MNHTNCSITSSGRRSTKGRLVLISSSTYEPSGTDDSRTTHTGDKEVLSVVRRSGCYNKTFRAIRGTLPRNPRWSNRDDVGGQRKSPFLGKIINRM